jgi:hypothetical protein
MTNIGFPADEEIIEITTAIVCPNNCLEYCPKEVFMRNYAGDKTRQLAFPDFKKILFSLPKNVIVVFSGFCEPFTNKETIKMVKFAHESGYRLAMFTTLRGASEADIEELLTIPFYHFCLHLPDCKHLIIPLTNEYMLNLFKTVQGIRNAVFMSMNDNFKSDNRENVVRGLCQKPHRFGYCGKRVKPQFVVLPNGDVQLCCRDFGLRHKMGNLLTEDYSQIRRRFLNSGKPDLCRYCSRDIPYAKAALYKMASMMNIV